MTSPLNYRGGRQFPQSILDDLDRRLDALESASKPAAPAQSRDDTGRLTSDYVPTPYEIKIARDAICREFGNNGTDGYYIRILKAIHGAAPAQSGEAVKPFMWFASKDPDDEGFVVYEEREAKYCEQDGYDVTPLYTAPQPSQFEEVRAASTQSTVPLTDQQRDAIEWAAGCAHVAALGKPINGTEGQRWKVLSDLFRASQDNHHE